MWFAGAYLLMTVPTTFFPSNASLNLPFAVPFIIIISVPHLVATSNIRSTLCSIPPVTSIVFAPFRYCRIFEKLFAFISVISFVFWGKSCHTPSSFVAIIILLAPSFSAIKLRISSVDTIQHPFSISKTTSPYGTGMIPHSNAFFIGSKYHSSILPFLAIRPAEG